MLSRTTNFLLWRFYRSYIVPLLILGALLSILFSGVLVVESGFITEPSKNILTPGQVNKIVILNLCAACFLMLCHAAYLILMARHLVYRFPVERLQWVSVVYIAIASAYFAHAWHTYMEATEQHGKFEAAGWSSGAFAIIYLAMSIHGITEIWPDDDVSESEHARPAQRLRTNWMLGTDIAVCIFATVMLLRNIDWLDWGAWIQVIGAKRFFRVLGDIPAVHAIYLQGSPKDAIIAFALMFYCLAQYFAYLHCRSGQIARNTKILAIQAIDSARVEWASIRAELPEKAVWLDLASGQGSNLRELIQHLYENRPEFPQEVIYLDKNKAALDAAKDGSPKWWPYSARQIYQQANMDSKLARDSQSHCQVIHMGHTAYQVFVAKTALRLLHFAKPGTLLLIRYTSGASFYRAISSSTSCAIWRPYSHHNIHLLLLADLKVQGWNERKNYILPRYCDIANAESRKATVDWCDAQYGEFSGDIIERYFEGFASAQQTQMLNADRLVLLEKSGKASSPPAPSGVYDGNVVS